MKIIDVNEVYKARCSRTLSIVAEYITSWEESFSSIESQTVVTLYLASGAQIEILEDRRSFEKRLLQLMDSDGTWASTYYAHESNRKRYFDFFTEKAPAGFNPPPDIGATTTPVDQRGYILIAPHFEAVRAFWDNITNLPGHQNPLPMFLHQIHPDGHTIIAMFITEGIERDVVKSCMPTKWYTELRTAFDSKKEE